MRKCKEIKIFTLGHTRIAILDQIQSIYPASRVSILGTYYGKVCTCVGGGLLSG